jgi:hypothetical protein
VCTAGHIAHAAEAAPLAAAPEQHSHSRQLQQVSWPGYAISRPFFVLFGDSITEFGWNGPTGWATLLAQHYSRKVGVTRASSMCIGVPMQAHSCAELTCMQCLLTLSPVALSFAIAW